MTPPVASPDAVLALAGFAFAATWTPGPNNMMLAASGATHGWRRTLPHALGVALGFPLMLFAVALGLGQAFEAVPAVRGAITATGCAVMLWLAWRVATAAPPGAHDENAPSGAHDGNAPSGAQAAPPRRPLSFAEAAAFQWVNPKAWVLCIGVAASYASGAAPVAEAALAAGVFVVSGLTSSQGWALFGAGVGRALGSRGVRLFNLAMGLLLALSALWLVLDPA
jgi:threonine/homoserine/homoserine lactone efflux protein